MATVDIDLLDPEAAHFADAATHLPLLVERLLAVIGQPTRLMESDVIPARPIGLFAAGDATPVAVPRLPCATRRLLRCSASVVWSIWRDCSICASSRHR